MIIKSTLRALLLATSLCVATGAAMARSAVMVDLGRQAISTPAPLTLKAVHDSIIAGGSHHTWRVVGDKPGVLTLEADSKDHQAVVDVAYDTAGYQITYKSSNNLNYEQSEKKTTIHPKYNKWIEDLNTSIHMETLNAHK